MRGTTLRSDSRSQSETIGFVLLFAVLITAAVVLSLVDVARFQKQATAVVVEDDAADAAILDVATASA